MAPLSRALSLHPSPCHNPTLLRTSFLLPQVLAPEGRLEASCRKAAAPSSAAPKVAHTSRVTCCTKTPPQAHFVCMHALDV